MKTRDVMRREFEKLCLICYRDKGLTGSVKAKDLLSGADYRFSDKEDELLDLLNFSLGMSKLWYEYKRANPECSHKDINKVALQYMINMWGLEEIGPFDQ